MLKKSHSTGEPFKPGFLEIKLGDTRFMSRFENPRVTLRAAAAKRYGGEIHDSSCCEFFMEAYGTRAVRAVAEVAAGWNGRGC